jgi:hypothetical protein
MVMKSNPILDELHAVREKLLADAGGDLHRYIQEANQRASESGRKILDPGKLREGREKADKAAPVLPLKLPMSDQAITAE